MQWCKIRRSSHEPAYQVQRQDRDVQLVTVLILKGEVFRFFAQYIQGCQPPVAAYTMLNMYDGIVEVEFGKGFDNCIRILGNCASPPSLVDFLTIQLAFSNDFDSQVRNVEPAFKLSSTQGSYQTRVSNEFVAEWRSRSTSSLIEESFSMKVSDCGM